MTQQGQIIKNVIKCKHCGDIIESVDVHDFKFCSCGRVAVDGGHSYLKRCADCLDDFEDLSVIEKKEKTDFETPL